MKYTVDFTKGGYLVSLYGNGDLLKTYSVDGSVENVFVEDRDEYLSIEVYIKYGGSSYDWQVFEFDKL